MKYKTSMALLISLWLVTGSNVQGEDCTTSDICPRPAPGPCVPVYFLVNDWCNRSGCKLLKSSFWDVVFPDGPSYRPVEAYGEGRTGKDFLNHCQPPDCWPIHYCPEAGSGWWVQFVDYRNVIQTGTGAYTCGFVRRSDDSRISGVTCNGGGEGGGEGGCCNDFVIPECPAGEPWNCDLCECGYPSPVLIDTQGDGFDLSGAAGGVNFDLDSDSAAERIAWTLQGSDDGWLALDRNGNHRIDNGRELFGNFTPQPPSLRPNGFLALAEYDKPSNGGNNDGKIDASDAIFPALLLWKDANHNGISERRELLDLSSFGIVALGLDFRTSKRTDQHGNKFLYRARVYDTRSAGIGTWAWDVFLVTRN